jgi:hypothetical protein
MGHQLDYASELIENGQETQVGAAVLLEDNEKRCGGRAADLTRYAGA